MRPSRRCRSRIFSRWSRSGRRAPSSTVAAAARSFATEAAQLISKELLGGELNAPTVDVLELGKSDTGQSQFRVGKRVNDRTLVTYTGSFAEGGKQKLRVEYQLLGPLLIAGEQDFSGSFGGDVILRFRFR